MKRLPKSEIRMPKKFRNPKSGANNEVSQGQPVAIGVSEFGFRFFFEFRNSNFGFQLTHPNTKPRFSLMGKPTGFFDYKRELPSDRTPAERILDWKEFHHHMEEPKLRQQGARCMDCGIPFCHTGTLISGMAAGCPIHNLIPEWNDLIYRGLWKEALERLHKTNNF